MRAVEDALQIQIPENARLIRNILEGMQYVRDHVIHFYRLHASDWVDVVGALRADPAATAQLAGSISDWPLSSTSYYSAVKNRLATLAHRKSGVFDNAYRGHPAYRPPPEASLMAMAHYLEALDWQRDLIRIHGVFGSKDPYPQGYVVGGMACSVDADDQNAINAQRLGLAQQLLAGTRDFVEKVYLPDLMAVASFYKDWAALGGGLGNLLAYGDFPMTAGGGGADALFLPRGMIRDKDLNRVHALDLQGIAGDAAQSWFDGPDSMAAPHSAEGQTSDRQIGSQPPSEFVEIGQGYTWNRMPRYNGIAVEVGPLARMLIAYASGHDRVRFWVDAALTHLDVGPGALFSTLGRTVVQGIEAVVLAEKVSDWVDELRANVGKGDLRMHDTKQWTRRTWPREATGWGWMEAPRGALAHWVQIKDGAVANYRCLVPRTWNASPRDAQGRPGAYEAALLDMPVIDPEQPIEILRTIHSFDPCMACAVRVTDRDRRHHAHPGRISHG